MSAIEKLIVEEVAEAIAIAQKSCNADALNNFNIKQNTAQQEAVVFTLVAVGRNKSGMNIATELFRKAM